DPSAYYTPDVIADFTSIEVKEVAKDRVRITNAQGKPAPEKLKVSIAYRDGYMCSGMLAIYGGDAVSKAKLAGQMILDRLKRAGFTFARNYIETIGAGAVVPLGDSKRGGSPPPEVMLRVSVHDSNKAALERFSKEFAPLVTA